MHAYVPMYMPRGSEREHSKWPGAKARSTATGRVIFSRAEPSGADSSRVEFSQVQLSPVESSQFALSQVKSS